ncbi:LOW QUALITY PROTEIN: uncharacterized protein [Amphiura filiformis]|uniref:LOW QUALITY PROTEIN: uncharacterized protein n=1 Tax=Amphiura filiformis TaxID=82378 RepID=UPI003B22412A
MGSGSSSRISTPESNARSMPEPTQGGQKGSQRPSRGRRQFEEVQLQDPDAPQRTASDASTGAGATASAPGAQNSQARSQPRAAPTGPAQPGYQGQQLGYQGQQPGYQGQQPGYQGQQPGYQGQQPGYQGNGGSNNTWQNAGHQVQSEQQVLNQFQTYKQAKLEAQPGQNPDEFFSMALQLQEMGDEGIIFGTYHHPNGKQYPCIQQGDKRFYLDSWDTQEWRPYPDSWNGFGYFVKDGDPLPDEGYRQQGDGMYQRGEPLVARSLGDIDVTPGLGGSNDDRAGSLKHPTRGTLLTYVFEEKRNIHCYFDEDSGMWVKMPVSWEQHTSFVKPLVGQIQETVPTWKDKYDIISCLRQSNYDSDDVISTYFTVGDTGAMDSPDRLAGVNKKMIKEKDEKIASLQEKFLKLKQMYENVSAKNKKLHSEYNKIKKDVGKMREQVSGLEVELKTANMKIVTLQQERPSRPPTAAQRRAETPEIETADSDPEPDSQTFEAEAKQSAAPKEPTPPPVPQGPVIDVEILKNVDSSAKELDKCQLTLKKEVKDGFEELNDLVKQAMDGLSQMKTMDSSSSQELDDLKVLYKKECLQRKLLYNKLQELRGNIRVFCRVRYDSRTECALNFPSDQDIMATNLAGKRLSYSFDRVFTPQSTQTEVFKEALPIITSCVDGYNVCIMAYGQTGAGKTYTMMGTKSDPGVNVRAIQELLKICGEKEQINYTLKVSMLEVYNEQLQDLLTDKESRENLDIKMQGKKLSIKGLTEVEVRTEDDITRVMDTGDANRSVAATKMNSTSSRSHLLLMLFVEGINKVSKATSYGSLTLVDLAGSERIAKTGATGQTLVEAAAINKSLTSLGQVFTGLRTSALHVPYRNSKLTHLLQPSLGGDAKACLFVNVSPDGDNIQESISTLTFGSGAKQVALGQASKNTGKGK